MPASTPDRTALYRLYDAGEELLYVGISEDPERRWRDHASRLVESWWPSVARKTVEWFDSRKDAAAAEVAAIREEGPRHNGHHGLSPMLALLPPRPSGQDAKDNARQSEDPRPVDARIAADARHLIMNGSLPLGSKFPSTNDLIERYGVSNLTIQRALKFLKEEGFARGVAGSGVYVASPVPSEFDEPEVQLIEQGRRVPPPRVAEMLRIEGSADALYEQHLLRAGGVPTELISSYWPSREAKAAATTSAADEVTARPPTTAEYIALDMPSKIPVLSIYRIRETADGVPTEAQVIVRPGHLHRLSYSTEQ